MGTRFHGGGWRAVLIALSLTCAIHGASAALAWQTNRLSSISIGGNTFSNVVVIEVTPESVTISHTRGLASFNPDKLLPADQERLGLIEPIPEAPVKTRRFERARGSNTFSLSPSNTVDFQARLEALTPESARKFLDDLPPFQPVMLAGPIVVYLFLCICFLQICSKAGKASPLFVWIPVLQIFALYRAARMPAFWFAALILYITFQVALLLIASTGTVNPQIVMVGGIVVIALAVVQLLGWIVWSFKICTARGKSPILGIFMLLPCTNVFALAYLAFSK